MPPAATFQETNLWSTPIRDLGLTIKGTQLEPVLDEFFRELDRVGVKLRPNCYLSVEWGVNFNTISLGIPFYLARPDLKEIHAEHTGFVEGVSPVEILRYLRHEMGHVVNYAYRLYEQEDWVKHFGSITQPYLEDYRPEPFSRRYVRHLPGFYAQKHPDEDWAETFAVWMTPGHDWAADYADWPTALAKLRYCDRTMAALKDKDPPVSSTELDEDVSELTYPLEHYYQALAGAEEKFPRGLDGALQAIFEDIDEPEGDTKTPRRSAGPLIRRMERELVANVYRWTGHFPERTRPLLRYLSARADQLRQVYPADREERVILGLTTLVTALAMNYVHRGAYMP
jgi:hypothetical protein